MARETLACEFDGHFWTREATRGRKPKRCPKHPTGQAKPVVPVEVIGYVDVPVTLRSTKTSKEAPGSPVEAPDPLLATLGSTRGRKPASEPLGPAKLTPGEKALVQSSRQKDLAAAKIMTQTADQAATTLERDEKIASGEWQELYCQNGDHDWDRPTNRGRKPVNCPRHPNEVDRDADAEEKRIKAERRIDNLEMLLMSRGTHIKQQKEKEFPMPNRPEYQDKAKGSAGSLKGSRRTVKATKRAEAEARNEKTTSERRSRKKAA